MSLRDQVCPWTPVQSPASPHDVDRVGESPGDMPTVARRAHPRESAVTAPCARADAVFVRVRVDRPERRESEQEAHSRSDDPRGVVEELLSFHQLRERRLDAAASGTCAGLRCTIGTGFDRSPEISHLCRLEALDIASWVEQALSNCTAPDESGATIFADGIFVAHSSICATFQKPGHPWRFRTTPRGARRTHESLANGGN